MLERGQILINTYAKALSLTNEARKTSNWQDTSLFQMLLWKSAAEAEYVVFQIYMRHGLSDYQPSAEFKRALT